MPQIMDTKEGTVDQWLKKEGDSFKYGERLCEVTLDSSMTIAVDGPDFGYIAKILVQSHSRVPVGTPIAEYTDNEQEFLAFRDALRISQHDASLAADAEKIIEAAKKIEEPDVKGLLRLIRRLINEGAVDGNSDFAKRLQTLARQGDKELLAVYSASVDVDHSVMNNNSDTSIIDQKFFLENAKSLLEERR